MNTKFYRLKNWLATIVAVVGLAAFANGQYCNSNFTSVTFEFVTNVTFAGINNTSAGTLGGPVNYTAQTANVTTGGSYSLSVTMDPDANDYIYAWIDWNQNNILNDAGEQYVLVSNSSAAGPHTLSIAVPPAATPGNTRMRVMVDWNNPTPDPCRSATWGEAEDYTVNVSSAPCVAPANGGTLSGNPSTICSGVNFGITATGTSYGVGTVYQWQTSPDGLVWSDLAGQTSSSFSGSQTAATNYRLRVVCTNGNDTAYSSNSVFVDLTPFLNCYCTSATVSAIDEDIVLVEIGSALSNASPGSNCATYTDYTANTPPNLLQGVPYPIRVDIGDCEGVNFYAPGVSVWIDYNHNGLFTDPGEQVFISDLQAAAPLVTHSGSFTIPGSALPGITRMRVSAVEGLNGADIAPCGTNAPFFSSYGEVEDYYVNIIPPPADEAGVLAITKPEIAACALGSQIWVNLQNLGTNPLTSVNYTVKINGLNIPVSNPATVNVPPASIMEVQIPITYSLADGDSIYVEVSLPNGQVENPLLAFNNIAARRVYAGLTGIKTVYGAGANFADVDAAIEALSLRGVCDTVYFKIASGVYNTQHTFVPYPGAGPGRLAVFESATGNQADVDFAFEATSAADNFTFNFDAANGYMVRNLTLTATSLDYGKVVTFANAPQNIWVDNNIILSDSTAFYDLYDFERINIAGFDGTDPKNIHITNNHVIGGNRSFDLEGSNAGFASNFTIEGNTFEHFNAIGVLIANVSNPVFNNNILRPTTGGTDDVYGYYLLRSIDGGSVSGNDMQLENSGTAVFLSNVSGGASDFLVSNNFIYNSDSSSTQSAAVYVEDPSSSDIVIANNSISYNNDATNAGLIYILDGSQIRLLNNNIGSFGNAPAIRVSQAYSVSAASNNNLFAGTLASWSGTQTTLAGLQSATGMNANSVSVNPGFNGSDLHTCAAQLNGAALSYAPVTSDFDGDARAALSDIGADEFLADANGLVLQDAFLKCPADQVTLGNPTSVNGVTYSWTPSGSGSSINVTAAGTYVISATSNCGTFKDTVVVTNKPLPTASFSSVTVGLASIFTNNSTNGNTYLWDFGDGNSSTEFSPSHVYENEGTYSVTLTVTNDCGTATFGPTAVNVINADIEENVNVNVSLFPNPTNGQFTVTMSAVNTTETTVSVLDVTGKTILVKNIPAGVNQITLDATTFASGIYSVKISNGDFTKVMRMIRK